MWFQCFHMYNNAKLSQEHLQTDLKLSKKLNLNSAKGGPTDQVGPKSQVCEGCMTKSGRSAT